MVKKGGSDKVLKGKLSFILSFILVVVALLILIYVFLGAFGITGNVVDDFEPVYTDWYTSSCTDNDNANGYGKPAKENDPTFYDASGFEYYKNSKSETRTNIDYCNKDGNLIERYCIRTGISFLSKLKYKFGHVEVDCPRGCVDGACVENDQDENILNKLAENNFQNAVVNEYLEEYGLQSQGVQCSNFEGEFHDADTSEDWQIDLSELLRVIQFFNSGSFHCDALSEDGYSPGPGDKTCEFYDGDYNPQDWQIDLSELLRTIQFFNSDAFHIDISTEDGFSPCSNNFECDTEYCPEALSGEGVEFGSYSEGWVSGICGDGFGEFLKERDSQTRCCMNSDSYLDENKNCRRGDSRSESRYLSLEVIYDGSDVNNNPVFRCSDVANVGIMEVEEYFVDTLSRGRFTANLERGSGFYGYGFDFSGIMITPGAECFATEVVCNPSLFYMAEFPCYSDVEKIQILDDTRVLCEIDAGGLCNE